MGLAAVPAEPPNQSHEAMVRIRPSLRTTETYTESNFLRLHTRAATRGPERQVTLEHLFYRAPRADAQPGGWRCLTIVDDESMSREDALFIAQAYAAENGIPVIYESHTE
jgi:hypothetical protein